MDRITRRWPKGRAFLPIRPDNIGPPYEEPNRPAVDRLADIEDILGDTYDLDRLRELVTADREGRLMVLPCKVGDTIYAIPSKVNRELNVINRHPENNRVYTQTVQNISFFPDGVYLLKCCDGLQMHHSKFFRESWFLTKEEAEAALAKDNNVPNKEEE